MPIVAGVDSSTQSTKIELRDADDGRLVGLARAPHPPTHPPVSEQDPHAWREAFDIAWAAALTDGDVTTRQVAALSVSGQQHGCVVLDELRNVVRPVKLWNDTTTAADAAWLVDELPGGAAGWANACGSVPVAAFTIAKLSWLHRSEPANWERLDRVCLPHDWLTLDLTGEFVTDRGDASGTGYWSPAEERYRFDLLGLVDGNRDWSLALPRVLGPIEAAGSWSIDGHDVLVGPGTGDNMAAALGIGLGPGDVAMSLGTSGTVYAVSDVATADPSGAVAGFADANGRYLPLVCTLNATKVTDAVARLLGVDASGLDALAATAEPDTDRLTLLPYFDGERTPNRPGASGAISGLRTDTTAADLALGAFTGVACGMLDALDALQRHARTDDDHLFLVGGGAASPVYRHVLADLSGRTVVTTGVTEAVATGACVQAAATLHRRDPADVRTAWGNSGQSGSSGASGPTGASTTEPTMSRDLAESIRARYAELSAVTAPLDG